ncbi:hypothetical protein [Singulisphaera sp. PoT]|uniref:hypothetical protein n=1 Tax=Singulisphaera sp. PoT TaxID=3411797 RepID=UPI003BF591B7
MGFRDISAKVFGKYQHCTEYDGVMYANCDFTRYGRAPVKGAIPAPRQEETRAYGTYRGPSRIRREKTWEERRSEEQQAHDLLERLAREAEPEGLAKRDELFEQAQAEHAKDVAGFKFECKRWGDFLNVSTARLGNPREPKNRFFYVEKPEQHYSTSVNLNLVTAIRLIEGHVPDMQGELGYAYNLVSDNTHGGTTIGGTGFGNYLAPSGHHWKVFPQFPRIPYSRPLFQMAKPEERDPENTIYMSDHSYSNIYTTNAYPRPAHDDVILFEGLNARLFVPAGKGQAVYEAILGATDKVEGADTACAN